MDTDYIDIETCSLFLFLFKKGRSTFEKNSNNKNELEWLMIFFLNKNEKWSAALSIIKILINNITSLFSQSCAEHLLKC